METCIALMGAHAGAGLHQAGESIRQRRITQPRGLAGMELEDAHFHVGSTTRNLSTWPALRTEMIRMLRHATYPDGTPLTPLTWPTKIQFTNVVARAVFMNDVWTHGGTFSEVEIAQMLRTWRSIWLGVAADPTIRVDSYRAPDHILTVDEPNDTYLPSGTHSNPFGTVAQVPVQDSVVRELADTRAQLEQAKQALERIVADESRFTWAERVRASHAVATASGRTVLHTSVSNPGGWTLHSPMGAIYAWRGGVDGTFVLVNEMPIPPVD